MNRNNGSSQLARRTLVTAVLLGALADALFRTALGVGFTIWVLAVAAGAAALVGYRDGTIRREVAGWLALAASFAVAFSWRGSEELRVWAVLAILVSLALARVAAVREPVASVFESGVADVITGAFRLAVDLATGFVRLVLRHARLWSSDRSAGFPIARVAFAAPVVVVLVLLFGALLAAADPVFAAWVDFLRWDFEEIAAHILFAALFAWLVGGALRGGLFRWDLGHWDTAARSVSTGWAPGVLEIVAILGSVAAVFTLFVAAQIAWIAGGAEFVQATTGLTFAEFARRGFFQLIVVAGLLLLVLLVIRPSAAVSEARESRWYTRLAYVLIALFAVMVISAAAKLRLYVHFYALSVPRLYAAVAIAWLALVFVWFVATVLRDRPRRFVGGVFVSAFAALALLYVANPDLLVTRYNLAHPPPRESGEEGIDFAYLANLSADAVPALLPAVIRQQPPQAEVTGTDVPRRGDVCFAAARLYEKWGPSTADGSWRRWNASEARARRLVRRHAPELIARSCTTHRTAKAGNVSQRDDSA